MKNYQLIYKNNLTLTDVAKLVNALGLGPSN